MRTLNLGFATLLLTVFAGFSQSSFAIYNCEGHLRPGMEVKSYSVDRRSDYQGRVPVPEGMNTQVAYDIVIIAGYSNTNPQVIRLDKADMVTNTRSDGLTGERVRGYFRGVTVTRDVPVQVIWKQ